MITDFIWMRLDGLKYKVMKTEMKAFELYMAPLKGFTDHTFRKMYTAHFGGFDWALAPFISSKRDHKFKKKYIKDILPENNTHVQVIPQILGNDSKDFIALAEYIFDWGHTTVNWNLGCPFPMVANKGRGAGLLPHTDRIHQFLDEVLSRIKGLMSIKLRLGWKTNEDLFRLTEIFNEYPLESLIIHPRTGIQRYEGSVDYESFEKCLEMLDLPIVYNGDIKTVSDFSTLSENYPSVKKWMIGRGCLENPFLSQGIKCPNSVITDKNKKMKGFHHALVEGYQDVLDGPSHVLNKMKGFWQYFSIPFSGNKKQLKAIKKAQTIDQYIYAVDVLMEDEGIWE